MKAAVLVVLAACGSSKQAAPPRDAPIVAPVAVDAAPAPVDRCALLLTAADLAASCDEGVALEANLEEGRPDQPACSRTTAGGGSYPPLSYWLWRSDGPRRFDQRHPQPTRDTIIENTITVGDRAVHVIDRTAKDSTNFYVHALQGDTFLTVRIHTRPTGCRPLDIEALARLILERDAASVTTP